MQVYFDFPACFSVRRARIPKQTICPLLKELLFSNYPTGRLSRKPYTSRMKCQVFENSFTWICAQKIKLCQAEKSFYNVHYRLASF
jgi:hypothetical protein